MSMMPPQYPCPSCGAEANHSFPRFIDTTPKWQLIETAKKTEAEILGLYNNGCDMTTVRWDKKEKAWQCTKSYDHLITITHWMPAPWPHKTEIEDGSTNG